MGVMVKIEQLVVRPKALLPMTSYQAELAEEIRNVGGSLLSPPAASDELLSLLDKAENILSKVEQAPSVLMQDSLASIMKALIANELLGHSNMDVKVSTASCLTEVTRITAPDAPYNDEIMKEIFQLTVAAFEKLSLVSGRCYSKALSILDNMAKIRSSLVMLDLECDTLIIEMFQIFLNVIRSNHPHAVFSSMETIMTQVLVESEEISLELLTPLLASVRKENQHISPMSWKLGERVIESCADRLKPCLSMAMQSTGMIISDYSQAVVSICQNAYTIDGSGMQSEDENSLSGTTDIVEQSQVAKRLVADDVHGVEVASSAQIGNDDTSVKKNPSNILEPFGQTNKCQKNDVDSNVDNLESMNVKESESQPEMTRKKRGRRPNSLMNPDEGYDHSWVGTGGALKLSRSRKHRNHSPLENPASKKAALPQEHEKNGDSQALLSTISQNEIISSFPDKSDRKMGRHKRKRSTENHETDPGSLSVQKDDSSNLLGEKSPAPAIKKAKPGRRPKKIALEGNDTHAQVNIGKKNEAGVSTTPEEKPSTQLPSRVEINNISEGGLPKEGLFVQRDKKKRRRVKTDFDDIPERSRNKKLVSGSATKLSKKDSHQLDVTSNTHDKRKCTPGKDKASGMPDNIVDPAEDLVGERIKVWWPIDQRFYEGVVFSFDELEKKHKVLYADGDEEILNLMEERWQLIGQDVSWDGLDSKTDIPSPGVLSDVLQKKKAKPKSPGTKQAKTGSSSKRGSRRRTPGIKSKDGATSSGRKSADDSTLDIPNNVKKSKDDTFGMRERLHTKDQMSVASEKSRTMNPSQSASEKLSG